MNLKNLTDDQLLSATEILVQKEREILTDILQHLREIERRRLFSSLGYKSLFEYAVKKFNYSEDQAYRRIAAMKLLKEIPELEDKINSGSLNLAHLSLAKTLFRQEDLQRQSLSPQSPSLKPLFSKSEKIQVLHQLENKTVREAQKIVLSMSSEPRNFIPEKSRQITNDLTELKFTITEELKLKMEKVKGIYAHSNPYMTTAELLEKLCDQAIDRNSATFRKRCVKKRKRLEEKHNEETRPLNSGHSKSHLNNHADLQCENCQSTYALEIDHIVPRAKGGTDKPENLRVLCRSCNQRAAIREFGQTKMDMFIN